MGDVIFNKPAYVKNRDFSPGSTRAHSRRNSAVRGVWLLKIKNSFCLCREPGFKVVERILKIRFDSAKIRHSVWARKRLLILRGH